MRRPERGTAAARHGRVHCSARTRLRCGRRLAGAAAGAWLLLGGATGVSAQTAADSAWTAGEVRLAQRLYEARLASDSTDELALHRLALARAWDARYEESLALFDRLLSLSPHNLEARVHRARVLAWRSDLAAATEALELVLETDSSYVPALAARAQFEAWGGDLVEAESRWRSALTVAPDDPGVHVGLGQTLRWQGRHAAALEALERAEQIAPDHPDARSERLWMRQILAPRAAASLSYATDSDENRILTAELSGEWHVTSAVTARARAYIRETELRRASPLERRSVGVLAGAVVELEPGWRVSGDAGGSGSSDGGGTSAAWEARVESPKRHRTVGSLTLAHGPLDESALLIQNAVVWTQGVAGLKAQPGPDWRIDGSVSVAVFDGSESNRRLAADASVRRRLSPAWHVGVVARGFGFEKDLTDGYFDPDLFWIAEAGAWWSGGYRRWRVGLEALPGLQMVGSGGEISPTVRVAARLGFRVGPNREVEAEVRYANAGLTSFSTGETDYRYGSVSLKGTWAFH